MDEFESAIAATYEFARRVSVLDMIQAYESMNYGKRSRQLLPYIQSFKERVLLKTREIYGWSDAKLSELEARCKEAIQNYPEDK